MQYHWGLGVGHLHAHHSTFDCIPDNSRSINAPDEQFADPEPPPGNVDTHATDMGDDADHESDNPEMALEDRDLEGWGDMESNTPEDGNNNGDYDLEDDEEMYE